MREGKETTRKRVNSVFQCPQWPAILAGKKAKGLEGQLDSQKGGPQGGDKVRSERRTKEGTSLPELSHQDTQVGHHQTLH
jgi:hypothetical protein